MPCKDHATGGGSVDAVFHCGVGIQIRKEFAVDINGLAATMEQEGRCTFRILYLEIELDIARMLAEERGEVSNHRLIDGIGIERDGELLDVLIIRVMSLSYSLGMASLEAS